MLAVVGGRRDCIAGAGSTKTVTETVTVSSTAKTGLGPPQERVEYGHITSLVRAGDHYMLRFDPALLLSGVTANKAAEEDGAVEPGEPVPNDNYVVDEGHRTFAYIVPDGAKVTVLTNKGDPAQLGATPVTVAELAKIVDGTSDIELYEPLAYGRLDHGRRRHGALARPAVQAVSRSRGLRRIPRWTPRSSPAGISTRSSLATTTASDRCWPTTSASAISARVASRRSTVPTMPMVGLREFLDMFESIDILEADAYEVAGVTYLRARVHFVHAEAGERMLEQHHILRFADGRITGIDQLCTGLHAP